VCKREKETRYGLRVETRNGLGVNSSHAGGTRPGQTRKKPKDVSERERVGDSEEREHGVGAGVNVLF
jgi:hypothetical protein